MFGRLSEGMNIREDVDDVVDARHADLNEAERKAGLKLGDTPCLL
jgi:hypothetical protein